MPEGRSVRQRYLAVLSQIQQGDTAAAAIFSNTLSGQAFPLDGLAADGLYTTPTNVTSADLQHLLDLKLLNQHLSQLQSRFPVISTLSFVRPQQFIASHPYPHANTTLAVNSGDGALDLRSSSNSAFLSYESTIFDILTTLNRIPMAPEYLTVQHALHSRLITEATQTLSDLDMTKELEWNKQKHVLGQGHVDSPNPAFVDTGKNPSYVFL